MEKVETERKQLNKKLKDVVGGELITVNVELFSPFVEFAKDYLAFFGSKDTLEIFYMRLIYDGLERLHRDLTEFVDNKKHLLDGQEWFMQHDHLAMTSDQPEDEE